MEELKKKMKEKNINIPFIGIDIYGMNKTISKLKEILGNKEGLLKYMKNSSNS